MLPSQWNSRNSNLLEILSGYASGFDLRDYWNVWVFQVQTQTLLNLWVQEVHRGRLANLDYR